MGEVFRARDTRLERTVAIKVLPSEVADNPQTKARFEREAKTISQLNHPHICTVHDFGVDDGTSYLVMEFVEGECLAERLGRGPLPLHETLRYGGEIAAALERAHRAGIVHRDLKPGNVMLTKTGAKLLDFGLARSSRARGSEDTTQEGLTAIGMVVGTVPYMSPEQLQGEEVDGRTDIFALGALLYEMATGIRAFAAPNSASLIARILSEAPRKPSELQAAIPPALEHLILTCLEKDREARFQCAADVAHQLRWIAAGHSSAPLFTPPQPVERRWSSPAWIAAALFALLAAVAAFLAHRTATRQAQADEVTFRQLTFESGRDLHPSISPDGKMFVFVRERNGNRDIFLQRVDGRSAINLTEDSPAADDEPAFSPDGSLIAFRSERDGGGIFVMGATGESVRRLTDRGHNPAWSPDGKQVVFSRQQTGDPSFVYGVRGLEVASLTDGSSRMLYDQVDVLQPAWSPHGHRIAYWTVTNGRRDIATIDSSGSPTTAKRVTNDAAIDWNPVWSPDGSSLYFVSDRNGTMNLWRIAIDEKSGETRGAPEPLRAPAPYAGFLSVATAARQTLYQSDLVSAELIRLRFDRSKTSVTEKPDRIYAGSTRIRHLAASPDGTTIAFTTSDPQEDVFVMNADGSGLRQLTNDAYRDRGISWWPDGSRVVFYSTRGGGFDAWSMRADGSGLIQLTRGLGANWPRVSPDGKLLAHIGDAGKGGAISDISRALPTETAQTIPGRGDARFFPWSWSADGRWIVGGNWNSRTDESMLLYSVVERRLDSVPVSIVMGGFVDERRVLFVDPHEHIGLVDIVTGETQSVGVIPSDQSPEPFTTRQVGISANGTIIVYRERVESDIWQMAVMPPD